MFSIRAAAVAIASVFVLSQGVVALTPAEVIANNNVIISQYQTINTALSEISTSSSGGAAISTAQTVVNQFNAVIVNLDADSAAMQTTRPPFTDSEAAPVIASFANYVAIHQTVMAALISKHMVFAQYAVTAPMAASLRGLEASINAFSVEMLLLIPTRSSDVTQYSNALDTSTASAISTYDQLCVPSPLFPAIMPICQNL